jgi:type II secretory pathway component PulK
MKGARGFALLAVLWVVVALGALTAGAVAHARADASVSGERVLRMRAHWAAEGCLQASLAALDSARGSGGAFALDAADTIHYANGAACAVTAYDPASRLNLDSLGPTLRARFDSLLRVDGDTSARQREALTTRYGSGRVNLNATSILGLAVLPGMTPAALRVIAEARQWRRPFTDMDDLLRRLPPDARSEVANQYPELVGRLVFRTAALVLTAEGWQEGTRIVATIEAQVVDAGDRAALVERRLW